MARCSSFVCRVLQFLIVLSPALFVVPGCGAEHDSDVVYRHVLVREDCAPWDGEAQRFSFYQSDIQCDAATTPVFEVQLWRKLTSGLAVALDGRQPNDAGGPTGTAMRLGGPRADLKSGRIKIRGVTAQEVEGEIDLTFPEAREAGAFRAKRCPSSPLCG